MLKRQIMVIRNDKLFCDDTFQGFNSYLKTDYRLRIINNYEWMERSLAEENILYKQPVSYVVIINSKSKKIFVSKRSSDDSGYIEKRLHGKWSLAIGGHIEKGDSATDDPIKACSLREVKEEIKITEIDDMEILGYINDDKDDVGKVHFGIVYILKTNSDTFQLNSENHEGRMMSIDEIDDVFSSKEYNFERWSVIILESVKEYVNSI